MYSHCEMIIPSERDTRSGHTGFARRYNMGYFGTMSEKMQYGREERIDYYKRYRFFKELAEETSEQDDWAFEERD